MASPPVDKALWPECELTRERAVAILEAQRQSTDEEGTYCVGGFGELTTVDASGVRTETIIRWPDLVGKKIDPDRRRLLGMF